MNDIKAEDIKFENNPAREASALIPVRGSGVEILNFSQQVDYAKFMATATYAVPKHLRQNVGACLAILDMAQRWGFQPYMVARLSYVVNDVLCFESQLIHAVIERFAPLRNRLRPKYEGEGEERRCIVIGHMKGEVEPLDYESPRIGKITPKNSPLWKTDPDQQLWYYSSRAWCRRHCPEVLLGIYGRDEIADNPHIGFDNAKDVTSESAALSERLSDPKRVITGEGFNPAAVQWTAGQGGAAAPSSGAGAGGWGTQVTVGVGGVTAAGGGGSGGRTANTPGPEYVIVPPASLGLAPVPAEPPAAKKRTKAKPEMEPIPEELRRNEPRKEAMPNAEPTPGSNVAKAAPDKGASLVRPLPSTPTEYAEHVDRWTKTAQSPEECEAQWAAEVQMRNKCGIVEEERAMIRKWVDGRIKELRGK